FLTHPSSLSLSLTHTHTHTQTHTQLSCQHLPSFFSGLALPVSAQQRSLGLSSGSLFPLAAQIPASSPRSNRLKKSFLFFKPRQPAKQTELSIPQNRDRSKEH